MFHVKHEGSTPPRLSPAQLDQLGQFELLLRQRAVPMGAIARSDLPRIHERHVLDALRGLRGLPVTARSLCDLGSGAGFPGVPIAIARPDIEVTLAERRRSRRAFLELVVDELSLRNATVAGRVEDVVGPFDACTARAFASPTESWTTADRLLAEGGLLLYWAGDALDVPDLPPTVVAAALEEPPLARGGPVVIMSRQ